MSQPAPATPPVLALLDAATAATRLAELGFTLRHHQLGGDSAAFGAVCAAAGDPATASVELTCAAVWAWGAALRAGANRHTLAAEAELFELGRAAAWRFLSEAAAGALTPAQAAAVLLAAAAELLVGNDEHTALAQRAAEVLASPQPSAVPPAWLALPLLLYAHAAGREPLGLAGRQLVVSASAFPELPLCWWESEPPTRLSAWAAALAGAAVACQGEPELVPWAARVASQRLPTMPRGDGSDGGWAADASCLMGLIALARALPRQGWPAQRRAEQAAGALGSALVAKLDAQPGGGSLIARLLLAFALYGFSVDPAGERVCC